VITERNGRVPFGSVTSGFDVAVDNSAVDNWEPAAVDGVRAGSRPGLTLVR